MGERLKQLRIALGLSQIGFADALGITTGAVGMYEVGKRSPSSGVVSLICKTFGVSEVWLRTGEGEMFTEDAETVQFKRMIDETFPDEDKAFRRRVFMTFGGLSDEQWDALEGVIVGLVKEQGEGMSETAKDILEQMDKAKEPTA